MIFTQDKQSVLGPMFSTTKDTKNSKKRFSYYYFAGSTQIADILRTGKSAPEGRG